MVLAPHRSPANLDPRRTPRYAQMVLSATVVTKWRTERSIQPSLIRFFYTPSVKKSPSCTEGDLRRAFVTLILHNGTVDDSLMMNSATRQKTRDFLWADIHGETRADHFSMATLLEKHIAETNAMMKLGCAAACRSDPSGIPDVWSWQDREQFQ